MKGSENKTALNSFLKTDGGKTKSNAIEIPSLVLPKGGGAVKGIDEKFSVNAVNGSASFAIPLPFSAARGASPNLNLSYNSGAGNGVFGLAGGALDPNNQWNKEASAGYHTNMGGINLAEYNLITNWLNSQK